MRTRLLLASFLLVGACGGDDTSIPDAAPPAPDSMPAPDGDNSTTAEIDVTWHLVNDTAVATCPAGATTATIYAQRAGDAQPFADLYLCSDGAGASMNLPAGDYTVWVELTDDPGTTLYAMSEDATLTLSPGETASADYQIDVANGFWDLSWILHTSGGAATTCAATNQNGVSVLSTAAGTTNAVDSIWPCSNGESPNVVTTDPVTIGDQVVSISVLDNANNAIGSAPDINATIDYGNQFVDLGTVTITLF